ncbi:unnamed protein product [Cylindrotheca closterium]|uniref:Methyltransferase type 11 domain-containing protein n=1 Tax=Cylindrotheca closterium TaxID=2856 RepID=A0AAD2G6U5_9STRA|nr:unnamed protein product [Cylindrotheca closterium]
MSTVWIPRRYIVTWLLLFTQISAFSANNNDNNQNGDNNAKEVIEVEEAPESISRRNLLTWPIGIGGAVVYGKLLSSSLEKLSRGDSVFPDDHERRVRMVLSTSLQASAQGLMMTNHRIIANDQSPLADAPPSPSSPRPFRVLEVGIGNEWRLARRGLYGDGLQELRRMGIRDLDVTGVDLVTPKEAVLKQARDKMQALVAATGEVGEQPALRVNLHAIKGSITAKLNDYPNGYFDAVICSLTLCSVDDQTAALAEIHRLMRSSGGTFGYLEHVAVDDDEPYSFLEVQQKVLDPLQQALADNCHLHRYTDETIAEEFRLPQDNDNDNDNDNASQLLTSSSSSSSYLLHERFLVDGMWPISCQCCGVIQQRM